MAANEVKKTLLAAALPPRKDPHRQGGGRAKRHNCQELFEDGAMC